MPEVKLPKFNVPAPTVENVLFCKAWPLASDSVPPPTVVTPVNVLVALSVSELAAVFHSAPLPEITPLNVCAVALPKFNVALSVTGVFPNAPDTNIVPEVRRVVPV